MEVKLIVLIEVKPGKSEEQIKLFKKLEPLVLNEKGCIEYKLSQVDGSEVQFVLQESWASQEDLAAHDKISHMQEADSISTTFRARPATVFKLVDV